MADWKLDKDLGSWPFTRQKDKWGYLNNPRWLSTPREFVHGGPDDYSGRENEEPQIFTPTGNKKYLSNGIVKHHQCGHWHLAESGGEGMDMPPYQPCVDTTLNNDYQFLHSGGGYGLPAYDFGYTTFTMGYYYDALHTNLIPGCFADILSMSENQHIFIQTPLPLAPGALIVYPCSHTVHPIAGDNWQVDPGQWAFGTEKYFHAYRGESAIGIDGNLGIAYDCMYRGTYYANLGYSVYHMGLYDYTGGVYTLIPGTLTYGPTWSVNLDPSLFTVALWPPGYTIYIGVQFALVSGILYFPYVVFAETPIHAQWLGSFNNTDCWEVVLDTDNQWISALWRCGVMPAPTLDFTALPTPITVGDPVTLTWSSDGYYVTLNEGIGQVAAGGSMIVYPTVTTVYTATATGPGGDTVVNRTVVVNTLTTAAPTTLGTTAAPTTLAPTTAPPALGSAWAYWKLEEAAGQRSDASGNGHHGTVTETGTGVVGSAAAKLGDGATFLRGNGSAYLDINGYPDVESNNHFFISFWVKVASGGSNSYVLLVDGDIQIYMDCSGANIGFEVYAGDRYLETSGMSFDALHFVSVYFDGSDIYIEIDNSPEDSDAGNTNITSWAYLYIGQTDTYTGLVTLDACGIWVGGEADATITNRADLWNGGSGYDPY